MWPRSRRLGLEAVARRTNVSFRSCLGLVSKDLLVGSDRRSAIVANKNMCSKTNEIYTCCIHFQGFFMAKNALVAGARPLTPLGEILALPRAPSWWGRGALYFFPKNPSARFSALRASVRPSQLQYLATPVERSRRLVLRLVPCRLVETFCAGAQHA